VPSFGAVRGPAASFGRFVMSDDLDSERGERGAGAVECSVQGGLGGQLRMKAGAAEKVDGDGGLFEKFTPVDEREIFVGAGEDGDEN